MEIKKAYCRELEDHSGFVVCEGSYEENTLPLEGADGGRDRWEKVLGLGNTPEEAWEDAKEDPDPLPQDNPNYAPNG